MGYFLAISCVISGWVMLRLMGSEHSQMVRDMESQARRAAQDQPLPSLTPSAPTPPGSAALSNKAPPVKPPATQPKAKK